MSELGADNTGVSWFPKLACASQPQRYRGLRVVYTVGAGDLAPDDAELGSANLLLGLVDVGDLLAKVEAVSSVSSG